MRAVLRNLLAVCGLRFPLPAELPFLGLSYQFLTKLETYLSSLARNWQAFFPVSSVFNFADGRSTV
jgi:hypothetical protein